MKHIDLSRFATIGAQAESEAAGATDDESYALRLGPDGGYLLLDEEELSALKSQWSEDQWLVVDAVNKNDFVQGLVFGFFRHLPEVHRASDADTSGDYQRPDLVAVLGLFPGLPTRIAFPLAALDAERLFLERTPGKLKTIVLGNKMPLDEVHGFAVGLKPNSLDQEVILTNLRLEDAEPDYPLPDTTIVDELGQWSRKSWPGKTSDADELVGRLTAADADTVSSQPANKSTYGGFLEKQLDATGYFRADHDGKRHILVDPDGYPFYSLGVDCVNESITARTDTIEKLYGWLPDRGGEYAEFWHGDSGRRGTFFDFLGANFYRAFGSRWWDSWQRITTTNLLQWGFNTVGNWSSKRYIDAARLPYVWPLSDFPGTERTVFRDFPDVFSPEFDANAQAFAEQLTAFRGDKNLIGYFLRNEPQWAFVGDLNLGEAVLENPEDLETKKALIAFLSERYGGDIGKLVDAWNWPKTGGRGVPSAPTSFTDLSRPVRGAASLSDAASDDLYAFSYQMVERYVRVPSRACRSVDPDHMNLGMRWAWISQDALYAGSDEFDVFSINCYQDTPTERITEVGERTGKPVLVGEFHHGALDRGLPATGIRGVATQEERGLAYRYYVETAAANPYSVGTHYFTLYDQAILGRFDGENFQIGLLDTCNRAYAEFVSEVSRTNEGILQVLSGDRLPPPEPAEEVTVGF